MTSEKNKTEQELQSIIKDAEKGEQPEQADAKQIEDVLEKVFKTYLTADLKGTAEDVERKRSEAIREAKEIYSELTEDEKARYNVAKRSTDRLISELLENQKKISAYMSGEQTLSGQIELTALQEKQQDLLIRLSVIQAVLEDTAITQPKRKERTKAEAKNSAEVPSNLSIPSLSGYQNALSLYPKGSAYMQHIISADGLQFRDGKIFFVSATDYREIGEAELQSITDKEGIEEIDLPLLKAFYSIFLTDFYNNNFQNKETITIYVPDLASALGRRRNLNREELKKLISDARKFHNMVGVTHTKSPRGNDWTGYYAVFNFEKYDPETNTITVSAPYLSKVIELVYHAAIKTKYDKRAKKTVPLVNGKNGKIITKPSHQYLVKASIEKERNKAAAENVSIICTLIEQAGNNVPRIKASTLIGRNAQLQQRLAESANKKQLIKRVFTKTWQLLRDQTHLTEVYKDIQLPDPNDPSTLPTVGTLDTMVFKFPHKGKIKAETGDKSAEK